jgi:hypothetical protein
MSHNVLIIVIKINYITRIEKCLNKQLGPNAKSGILAGTKNKTKITGTTLKNGIFLDTKNFKP